MPTAGKDFCTQCERKVHNLSGMTEVQRRQFLATCSGKVCIAYAVPHARRVAAMRVGLGMLAAMVAAPVVAQDPPEGSMSPFTGVPVLPYAEPSAVNCDDANQVGQTELLESILIMGGVTDPQNVRWVEADAAQPVLPVVSDDAFGAEFIEEPASPLKR